MFLLKLIRYCWIVSCTIITSIFVISFFGWWVARTFASDHMHKDRAIKLANIFEHRDKVIKIEHDNMAANAYPALTPRTTGARYVPNTCPTRHYGCNFLAPFYYDHMFRTYFTQFIGCLLIGNCIF